MRILAVSGSLQARSSNLTLLRTAIASAPEGVEIVLFDGIRDLPLFDPDLEEQGIVPPAVTAWREAIARSDALLVASPEYGHSLPGALKNAIDWLIGSGELERKVVAITAAVPGPERGRLGLAALRQTLGAVSARIVGGEPIAKGPGLEGEVRALVRALVEEARRPPPLRHEAPSVLFGARASLPLRRRARDLRLRLPPKRSPCATTRSPASATPSSPST